MTVRPGQGRRLLRAGALAAALGLPVAVLAFGVRAQVPLVIELDERAVRAATDVTRSSPVLHGALVVWQELLQPAWVNVAVLATCAWAGRRYGLRTRARWTAMTVLLAWGVEGLAKLLVQRARPVVEDAVGHSSGFSFPSGHAANTTSAGIALTVLLWPLLGPTARRVVPAGVGGVVVLTALDRVFLGVHHPSDVVAGILLGGAVAGASYVGFRGRLVRYVPGAPAGRRADVLRPADAAEDVRSRKAVRVGDDVPGSTRRAVDRTGSGRR